MALNGQVCIVTGASGLLGGAITKRFLAEGATVVAPVRSEAALAKLKTAVSSVPAIKLDTPVGDFSSAAGAAALAAHLSDSGFRGKVDHVVSIGGGYAPPGVITAATPATLAETVSAKIETHLWLAKEVLPLMAADPAASYTIITGLLGEAPIPTYFPEAGLTVLANAAVYGFVLALQSERKAAGALEPRINEVRLSAIIPDQASPEAFAAAVLRVTTGKQADSVIKISADDLKTE